MGRKSILAAIVAIGLAGAIPALAANVSGVVTTPGGRRVAGIKVMARNLRGATMASAVSSANGEYTLSLQAEANYRFALDLGTTGFKKGDPVGALVPRGGLTLNWVVSRTAGPLAYARPAAAAQLASNGTAADPPMFPEWSAFALGATGIVAGGAVGGVAAAGGFGGGSSNVASSSK
jgi:Carboxypeptidase regulatory-like domain